MTHVVAGNALLAVDAPRGHAGGAGGQQRSAGEGSDDDDTPRRPALSDSDDDDTPRRPALSDSEDDDAPARPALSDSDDDAAAPASLPVAAAVTGVAAALRDGFAACTQLRKLIITGRVGTRMSCTQL